MKPCVVLTFDLDGWRAFGRHAHLAHDELLEVGIPRIVAFLKQHGLDATFFMVGQNVIDFPALHRDLAPYDLGNHSFTHPRRLDALPTSLKRQEILHAHQAISETLGIEPRVFRAPHYRIDSETIQQLKEMNYQADSSLLRVLFPLDYAWHGWRQRALLEDPFELPLTSLLLPFNGTAAINYRLPLTRALLEIVLRRQQTVVLNFHDKDFVDIPMPRWRLRNRHRALATTRAFLELLVDRCQVISVRQHLSLRR
jgi:peptidoglycan/xylan/chitin deacetylase (PgdA/CDA1 family)